MSLATYATRDIDIGGVLYTGKLVNEIEVKYALSNLYYGFFAPTTFQVRLANVADTELTQLFAVERRGTPITVKRWDAMQGGAATVEVTGRITGYEVGDEVTIDCACELPSVLLTPIPRQTITVQGFPKATDLGVTIPVLFGNVKKLPLAYIFEDTPTNVYIYLVGYAGVTPTYLYRDGVLVDGADYTVYNGTYNNSVAGVGGNLTAYTVVVFRLRQVDFGGRLYDRKEGNRLTADVTGMAAERNFARAIRSILSNATWGLGQSVDAATFDQEEAALAAIGGLYCDGWLLDQRPAKEHLDDLASVRGMRFWQTSAGAWALAIDTAATSYAATFGYADDLGVRNLVDPPVIRTRNLSEEITTLDAEYRRDPISNTYLQVSAARTVSQFGQPKRISLPFVRDHTTADKIIDYQAKKHKTLSRLISTRAGHEADSVVLADRVVLIAPPYGLYGGYEVRGLSRALVTTGLDLSPYDADCYTYTAGTMPIDETPDTGPDLSRTPPGAPGTLLVTGSGTEQSTDGTTLAYFDVSWTASATAGVTYLLQIRKIGESTFATADDTIALTARIRGLTPGLSYDIQVVARSRQGLLSAAAQRLNQVAPGDATPPTVPTGLVATGGVKLIDLDWADNTEADLLEYGIYRNTSNNPASAALIAKARASRFVDASAVPNTTYYYWITAYDRTTNESAKSTGASGVAAESADTTPPVNPSPPTLSSNGSYQGTDGSVVAFLVMNIPAMPTRASHLNMLYRRTGNATWQLAVQTSTGGSTIRIDGLTPGQQYDVACQAFSSGGGASAIITATSSPFLAPGDVVAPAAPSGLTATGGVKLIDLDWNDSTESDLLDYGVYRNTSNDPTGATRIAKARASRFVDASVVADTPYYYWITAYDRTGNQSAKSSVASATATAPIDSTPPANPSPPTFSSSGTYLSADGTVLAEIIMNMPAMPTRGAVLNLLYRLSGLGDWQLSTQKSTGGGTAVLYVTPGLNYAVAVQAFGNGGGASSIITATGSPFLAPGDTTAPGTPGTPTITDKHLKTMTTAWAAPSDTDIKRFHWEAGTGANGSGSIVHEGNSGSNHATVTLNDCAYYTTYYFRVKAADFSGNVGAFSTSVSFSFSPTIGPDIGNNIIDVTKLVNQAVTTAIRQLVNTQSQTHYGLGANVTTSFNFSLSTGAINMVTPVANANYVLATAYGSDDGSTWYTVTVTNGSFAQDVTARIRYW